MAEFRVRRSIASVCCTRVPGVLPHLRHGGGLSSYLGPLLVFQQGLSSNARRKNGPHLWQQSLSCFLVRFLRAEWGSTLPAACTKPRPLWKPYSGSSDV